MVSDRKALAFKHVTRARDIVAKQRELIAKIRARGGNCEHEEDLLSVFERSLAIFENDLASITKEQSLPHALNLGGQQLDNVQ